jgi:hypothetical protein
MLQHFTITPSNGHLAAAIISDDKVCETCGYAPCAQLSWCRSCREADRKQEALIGKKAPVGVRILSSADFIKEYKPPDYLVDGLLPRQFFYSMTGKTGGGKTAIALFIAAMVALGKTVDGREYTKGRVLYLAGEKPGRYPAALDCHGATARFRAGQNPSLLYPRRVHRFTDGRND